MQVLSVATTGSHIRVLYRYCPPPPIDPAHDPCSDAGSHRFVDIPVYVELRMHHGDVFHEETNMHNWRFARARSEWSCRAVQAPHQIQIFGPCRGPRAIHSDELGVVGQRLNHAVSIMTPPCLVEPEFDVANCVLVGLASQLLSPSFPVLSAVLLSAGLIALVWCRSQLLFQQLSRCAQC